MKALNNIIPLLSHMISNFYSYIKSLGIQCLVCENWVRNRRTCFVWYLLSLIMNLKSSNTFSVFIIALMYQMRQCVFLFLLLNAVILYLHLSFHLLHFSYGTNYVIPELRLKTVTKSNERTYVITGLSSWMLFPSPCFCHCTNVFMYFITCTRN